MSGADRAGALEQKSRALLEGLRDDFTPQAEPVRFGGKSMTFQEMVAAIEEVVGSFQAVRDAESAFRRAIANRRRAMKGHRSTYEDAVCFLKHHLGKDSAQLAKFGIARPRERTPLSAEANAISRAKAAATRKARGTLGRRQRLLLGRPPEPTLQVFGADGQPLGASSSTAIDSAPALEEPEPARAE